MASAAAHQRPAEDARQKEIGRMARRWRRAIALTLCAAYMFAASGSAVEDLAQLQQHFDQETDGVRKARLLRKLGDAQFSKEREATVLKFNGRFRR